MNKGNQGSVDLSDMVLYKPEHCDSITEPLAEREILWLYIFVFVLKKG